MKIIPFTVGYQIQVGNPFGGGRVLCELGSRPGRAGDPEGPCSLTFELALGDVHIYRMGRSVNRRRAAEGEKPAANRKEKNKVSFEPYA